MDADQIRALEPSLHEYLGRFADCFPRRDTRAHFPRYIQGQLSDLPRKSVEPMALKMDVPVRTLQEFLSQHKWDQEAMRDRVQQICVTNTVGTAPAARRSASSTKPAPSRKATKRLACSVNIAAVSASRRTASCW